MVKKIAIVTGILIAGILIAAAFRPDEFRVSRSALLDAPPAVVFAHVNDFHAWRDWSPWAKLDPAAKETFDGAPSGAGAGFAWAGNKDVGEGQMKITESRPNEYIQIRLEFFKPFKGVNTTEFAFEAKGAQTQVTWTMSGHNNYMAKVIGLVMNCEKMAGGQFEKGLANLEAVSKSGKA